MSLIATRVHSILNNIFPANPHRRVVEEYYVRYKGNRLFFDFFIPEMSVFIECQGRQHFEFVKHFHGCLENFKAQRFRDNLKIDYVQENDMYLVRFYEDEDLTESFVFDKINKVFECEFNFFE